MGCSKARVASARPAAESNSHKRQLFWFLKKNLKRAGAIQISTALRVPTAGAVKNRICFV